jgi:hypothetical protein
MTHASLTGSRGGSVRLVWRWYRARASASIGSAKSAARKANQAPQVDGSRNHGAKSFESRMVSRIVSIGAVPRRKAP